MGQKDYYSHVSSSFVFYVAFLSMSLLLTRHFTDRMGSGDSSVVRAPDT